MTEASIKTMKCGRKKGSIPWNKGLTKQTDERVGKNHWSANSKIRKVVCEKLSRQKMGNLNPSKKPEVRLKISETQKGRISWNKGLKGWTKKYNDVGFQEGNEYHGYSFPKGHIPWNYIDGKSKSRYGNFNEWIKIAKKCYERDEYICQECGQKGGLLHAHHVIPWSISKNNDLNNLITLCPSCHNKEHMRLRNDKN